MGCSNCSNNSNGKPKGCKSNASCTSGGCNQMSVYNWLSNVAYENPSNNIIEVSFKNGRKTFCINENNIKFNVCDYVVVDTLPGYDIGKVSLTGELIRYQMSRKNIKSSRDLKKIYRKASEKEIEKWEKIKSMEKKTLHKSRDMALALSLEMKISDVEYQGDGEKATIYYTAEDRVDFRELIKVMSIEFKVRIEMKQIGSRQESARLGGIGSCGRELCCSTWMTGFKSVQTSSARYQQLALNPQKLAGQCGKLKCCLNYELDQYLDELKTFPNKNKILETKSGKAKHFKTDVFKKTMWYFLKKEDKGTQILSFTVDQVHELIKLNNEGVKPEDFSEFIFVKKEVQEPEYSNVVGQDDLTRFDKVFKRKKKKKHKRNKRLKSKQ